MDRPQANGATGKADTAVSDVPSETAASIARSEQALAEARARFHESLAALNLRFDELRDWRAWFRRHPLPFLLTAATLGALLGWRRPDP